MQYWFSDCSLLLSAQFFRIRLCKVTITNKNGKSFGASFKTGYFDMTRQKFIRISSICRLGVSSYISNYRFSLTFFMDNFITFGFVQIRAYGKIVILYEAFCLTSHMGRAANIKYHMGRTLIVTFRHAWLTKTDHISPRCVFFRSSVNFPIFAATVKSLRNWFVPIKLLACLTYTGLTHTKVRLRVPLCGMMLSVCYR